MSDAHEVIQKPKVGHPPIQLSEEQKQRFYEDSKKGIAMDIIAINVGISERTCWNRIRNDREVRALYQKGRAEFKAGLIETAVKFAKNPMVKHENLSLLIFMLKTQCGWSEKRRDEPPEIVIRHYRPDKYKRLDPSED